MPTIKDISFNNQMTIADIIETLGQPIQYFEYTNWQINAPHRGDLMTYQVIADEIEYRLEFWITDDTLRLITLRFLEEE